MTNVEFSASSIVCDNIFASASEGESMCVCKDFLFALTSYCSAYASLSMSSIDQSAGAKKKGGSMVILSILKRT